MNFPIPVNEPLLDGNEKKYLVECIDSGWISSEGPFVKKFEEEFAARVGRTYGVAVSNGSAALEAVVLALGIGVGDEVILPTFTIISCAAAILRAGATPVLVDADPLTWNMDVTRIEERITIRTKAIMAVHIYGLPVDMEPLLSLAERHALYVIEDAAEAHGLTYQGRPCGSFGAVSTFSFYPNKLVTSGEGGMIVTDDPALAERCRGLRNLCFQKKRFVHEELGFNYRMTNLQAAVGLAQLERLDEFIVIKRRMGKTYTALLSEISSLQLPLSMTSHTENIYWVYGVVMDDSLDFEAETAMSHLASKHIGTRPFFWCMHEQPVFRRMGLFVGESYPVAEKLARRGFYIPSGLSLKKQQMVCVSEALRDLLL